MTAFTPADQASLETTAWEIRRIKQHQQWTALVEKFYQQIRYGCEDRHCQTPTCRACQEAIHATRHRPYRAPTRSTATALATALASEPEPTAKLCMSSMKPVDSGDGAFAGTPPGQIIDEKSLIQQLFNTKAWKAAGAAKLWQQDCPKILATVLHSLKEQSDVSFSTMLSSLEISLVQQSAFWSNSHIEACFEFMHSELEVAVSRSAVQQRPVLLSAAALMIVLLEPNPLELTGANQAQWLSFRTAVGKGPLVPSNTAQPNGPKFYKYLQCALSRSAMNCATAFFRLLYGQNSYFTLFEAVFQDSSMPQKSADSTNPSSQSGNSLIDVLCVWAKLVFRDNWESSAVVEESGHAHCALNFLDKVVQRKRHDVWPAHTESYAQMSLVGDRIDVVKEPPKYISRKVGDLGVHLMDFKWLFSQRERVVYFRSMNFHRMLQSFEKAMEANALMLRMYNTYKETSNSELRREEIFTRLKSTVSQCFTLQVRREKILEDTLNSLWRREQRELLRPLKVKFINEEVGEEGVDLGGLQQEFFRLVLARALDPELGLFTVDGTNRMTWFRALSPAPLYQFALIGMLFSLAIYNGITLPVTFPRVFYKWLKGTREVTLEDLEDGWPEIYQSLKTLGSYDAEDFEDVFAVDHTFTLDVAGRKVEVGMDKSFRPDLASILAAQESSARQNPNKPVTRKSRDEYLKLYTEFVLYRTVRPQLDAFTLGFSTLFSAKDLDIITAEDFRNMVEGEQQINVVQLRRVARYEDGFHADSTTVHNFWSIVETYNQEQLRCLLEFVTATDRMPVAGMQDLVFVIMKSGDGGPGGKRLPSSHTCFNRLMLPDYSSREILEQRLSVVIQNSQGFGIA